MPNHSTIIVVRPSTNNDVVLRSRENLDAKRLTNLMSAQGRQGDLVHFNDQWHRWTGKDFVAYNKRLPRKVKNLVT